MVIITFKENLEKFFIPGVKYRDVKYPNVILMCTGVINNKNCKGFYCGTNEILGECDGQCKPTFVGFSNGLCATNLDGSNRYMPVLDTNEKW